MTSLELDSVLQAIEEIEREDKELLEKEADLASFFSSFTFDVVVKTSEIEQLNWDELEFETPPVASSSGGETLKCATCQCDKPIADFMFRNKPCKNCIACRTRGHCIHGKKPYCCKECGGKGICTHGRMRNTCKQCGGNLRCSHNRIRANCKDCDGKNICIHKKIRRFCMECGGTGMCSHGKQKSRCIECGGGSICKHKIFRTLCKECGGGGLCDHEIPRSRCKECGGGSYCDHGKRRGRCRECGGGQFCEHDRLRDICKKCIGGSICPHSKIRSRCKECGGSSFCEHDTQKSTCIICSPIGHLVMIVRGRIHTGLKNHGGKNMRTIDYLGCTAEFYHDYLTSKLEDGMTWDNYGEWQVDHIIPLAYQNPTDEQVIERLHWSNTQPLWKADNASKGHRYVGKPSDQPFTSSYSELLSKPSENFDPSFETYSSSPFSSSSSPEPSSSSS